LVYLAIYRRLSGIVTLKTGRQPQPRGTFLGYFDVENQIPDNTAKEQGPAELAALRIIQNPWPEQQELEGKPKQPAQPNCDKWLEVQDVFIECANARQQNFKRDGSDRDNARPLYQTLDPISQEA
jgi:hypothetical protein